MHRTLGRLVEHKGYSTRIFWNGNMLSIMRRHYHNTLNRELAEMLGVSERSVTRKAREMGLEKDKGFVASLSRNICCWQTREARNWDIRAASPRG